MIFSGNTSPRDSTVRSAPPRRTAGHTEPLVTGAGSTTDVEDTRERPCRCARVWEPYHRGHGIYRCIPTRRSATVGMTDNTAAGLTPRGRVTFARIPRVAVG